MVNIKNNVRYFLGSTRSRRAPEELIRDEDFYALLARNLAEENSRYRRVGHGALFDALTHDVVDSATSLFDPEDRYRAFGDLVIRQQSPRRLVVVTDRSDEYTRRVNQTPHIELHFAGNPYSLRSLPVDALRLVRYIRNKELAERYPFVIGTSHGDLVRIAERLGMKSHQPTFVHPNIVKAISRQQNTARQVRGLPVVPTTIKVVSMPTVDFAEMIEKRYKNNWHS